MKTAYKKHSVPGQWACAGLAALLICVGVSGTARAAALSDDAACVVLSLNGGGSVTRGNTGVRSSIQRGDTIYVHDRLNLPYGSHLSVSFDYDALNIMEFKGPCTIKFITTTKVELSNGQASVVLDNKRRYQSFQIDTPSASARSHDAHFQVEVKQQVSEVRSYKSNVDVYGVDPSGNEVLPGVSVEAGQKTAVLEPGVTPTAPSAMTDRKDLAKVQEIKEMVGQSVDWVKKQTGDWLQKRFKKRPDDGKASPSVERGGLTEGDKDGQYLF